MRGPLALLALAPACTLGNGDHFGVLDARVDAALVAVPERDAGGGFQRLDTDFEVSFTTAGATLEQIDLIDSGDEALGFDPANPPPGYSLCHNGHCHADDGSLVSYEDIARMLGLGGGETAVVSLPVGEVDLVAGFSGPVACTPSCQLPRAQVGRLLAHLPGLIVEGTVRDGREPPRLAGPLAIRLVVDEADEIELDAEVDLPFDRGHDPEVALTVGLAFTAAMLDGIDWSAVIVEGGIAELSAAANPEAFAAALTNLGEMELIVEMMR